MNLANFQIKTALLSALFATCISTSATATNHGNNMVFDKPYGQVGNWRILHGRQVGDSCVAEQDNARVTVRILHTDYTGEWRIGVPYYNNDRPIGNLSIIFNRNSNSLTDAFYFDSYVINGWAMTPANNILDGLKSGSMMFITLDRGEQRWSLAGSSRAIAMVRACARNLGRRPARRNNVRPGPRPNTVQPGGRPNTVQPGGRPNTVQPRRRPNTVQPWPRPNTVQPTPGQSTAPGAQPRSGQPPRRP